MTITVQQKAAWTVLALEGDLDLDTSPGVYLQFQRELLQGRTRILIDMDRVGFVDSSGLGVLVRCYRDARSRGGEVALQRVQQPIERILEFTKLDAIFRILPPDAGADAPRGNVRLEAA